MRVHKVGGVVVRHLLVEMKDWVVWKIGTWRPYCFIGVRGVVYYFPVIEVSAVVSESAFRSSICARPGARIVTDPGTENY